MKILKTLGNNIAWVIIGIGLAISGGVVLAINVTVPQATQKGDIPTGLTTGNYQLLHPGTNGYFLAASSTSTSGLEWKQASTSSASLTGGTNGYVTRWISPTSVGTGVLLDNGTVAGVNATSSTASFNVQGSGSLNPFVVASSTGTQLLTVLANGNVGINNSSPTNKFTVFSSGIDDTAYVAGTAPHFALGDTQNYASRNYDVRFSLATRNGDFWPSALAGDAFIMNDGSTQGRLLFSAVDPFNSGPQVALTPAGRFGIGTTSPVTVLSVVGSTTITSLTAGCVNSTANGGLYVASCASGGSGNSAWTIGTGLIYNATSTDLVGIGTITPTSTLFVQGKSATNPFVVASSTGTAIVTIGQNGSTTITSLGLGTVQSTGGGGLFVIGNTGTGLNVLQTSPTLVTPILGVASGTALTLSNNLWVTGQSNLTNASVTNFTVLTDTYLKNVTNTFLATDPSGKIIATTTPVGGGSFTPTAGQNIYLTATSSSAGTFNAIPYSSFTVNAKKPQTGTNYTTIQAALDACGVAGGGTIELTDSLYAQAGTGLRFKGSNCNIYGRNASTTITFTGATTLFKSNLAAGQYSNNGLHDVIISGDGNANSVAFDASDMSHGIYENVIVDNVATGLTLNDTQNVTFYNTFTNWQVTTIGKFGINASSTNPVNDNVFNNFFTGCSGTGCFGLYMNQGNNNKFYGFKAEPANANNVGIRLTTTNGGDGLFDNQFYGSYIEANGVGVSITSDLGSGGGLQRNSFYGGIIDANTTDISASSSTSYLQNWIGVDNNFGTAVTSFQGPVGINNIFPAAVFDIFDPGFSTPALNVANNANFAHTSTDFVRLSLVNAGDSSNLFSLYNKGTGYTLVSTSTTNSIFFTSANRLSVNSSTPNSTVVIQGSSTAATLPIFTVASSTGSQFFTVLANGNAGVNTTTPASKFAITGSASTSLIFSVASSTNASVFSIAASGDALFKSVTNSATALQVQNSSGQAALTVSTSATYPYFAIGTTTASSVMFIQGTSTQATMPFITLASSSGTTLFEITSKGYPSSGGTAPTTNSGVVVVGSTNVRGRTIPAAAATTATITFAEGGFGTTPFCTVTQESGTAIVFTASSTPTTLVLAGTTIGSDSFVYQCWK